ncbi:MAG: DUF5655 domain-containing protein [Ilumatobacteraceae bacterium]
MAAKRQSPHGWTCSECGRFFERTRQSHDCAPGLTLDEYFASGPAHERPVFDAVMGHLATLGPVHPDIVSVGIFLKNPRKFAELRPMQHWVAVSFALAHAATHRTITRKVIEYHGRHWHVANVASPADVDDAFCELLSEAYHDALR